MAQFDWSKFSMKIYINSEMQRVYDAWATKAGLENSIYDARRRKQAR